MSANDAAGSGHDPGRLRNRLHRILQMVKKETRQLFRDPRTKQIIFIAPIVQLLMFGYAVNTDVRRVTTFVVDHDRTAESRRVLEAFTASGYFSVIGQSDDPDDLQRSLDAGKATIALWVPAGFAKDLHAGRGPAVQVFVDGANANTATIAQGYAARITREVAFEMLREQGGLPPGPAPGVDLRVRALYNPSLESRFYNVPAVIGSILFLMTLLLTSMAVVRERETGTLEQLLVSPLTPGELMLGKTIPVAGIAMIQATIATSFALLWFHVPLRGPVLALLLAGLLFIIAGLSIGLLISTISSTQQEAFLGMYLIVLPAVILSGFLYPVETMPRLFQILTLANPLRHFLLIVRTIFLKGTGIADLWPEYVTLAAMGAAVLGIATVRFRRTLA